MKEGGVKQGTLCAGYARSFIKVPTYLALPSSQRPIVRQESTDRGANFHPPIPPHPPKVPLPIGNPCIHTSFLIKVHKSKVKLRIDAYFVDSGRRRIVGL